jgi:hypothetical protein
MLAIFEQLGVRSGMNTLLFHLVWAESIAYGLQPTHYVSPAEHVREQMNDEVEEAKTPFYHDNWIGDYESSHSQRRHEHSFMSQN